jgi:hypothetical protein
VLKPILKYLATKHGVRLYIFIDNVITLARVKKRADKHYRITIETLESAGFSIAAAQLTGLHTSSRSIEYLGFIIDTKHLVVNVPKGKMECFPSDRQLGTLQAWLVKLLLWRQVQVPGST